MRLKKELRLLDVYAISTGATLSAGFFLLPGIAAAQAGSAIVLSYVLAGLLMIPASLSIIELASAMPRAGGVYYFLDRSLGPLVGTVGGLGTWLALVLKVSFALVGIGVYTGLFFTKLPITAVAILLALALGIINLFGVEKSGKFQVMLVFGLLTLLTAFITGSLPKLQTVHFSGFFDAGSSAILSTTGLVYISYVGVTKVASLSEEIKDPEHTLPRAILLSLATAILVYGLGTAAIVGLVPPAELVGDLAPAATAAENLFGFWGKLLMTIAAILAFSSVANAGTLSASRYPLAMSRDGMLPPIFQRLNKRGTPAPGIAVTVAVILLILLFLDATKIAKLASAFQLLMFALVSLAVIVMRESQIDSYDPGYRSPLYPWMQIAGILGPFFFIAEMGEMPLVFSCGLIVAGVLWYRHYAKHKVEREGAIYHLFERLGQRRDDGLDRELRGILKEKGLRRGDPFDEVVARSVVIDLPERTDFDDVVDSVARQLAERVPASHEELREGFLQGTRVGATPVTRSVALPHLRLKGLEHPEIALVRAPEQDPVTWTHPEDEHEKEERAYALFFLISPEEDPAQHLRLLAQIAGRVDENSFRQDWFEAHDAHGLKEVMLRDESFLTLAISQRQPTGAMLGHSVREVQMPEGTLITLVRRNGRAFVPNGSTVLEEGDRITIIGSAERVRELEVRYVEG